ncbi:MAG TPA: response regulator [Methanocorpusculum sp.]|nr:response regulator [Methanocorpusculum sp.]
MEKKSIVNDPGKILFVVCVVLVIAMLVFGAFSTVTTLSENLRNEHIKSFEASIEQSAQTLSFTAGSTEEYARLLASSFENEFVSGTDLTAFAESRAEDTSILNGIVVCIDSAGNTYTSENDHTVEWRSKSVLVSPQKETIIVDYLTGPPDPKYLLVVEKLTNPVIARYHDRPVEITHVAVGRTVEYLNSIFSAAFPVPTDTFIVSSKGKLLTATYNLGAGIIGDIFINGDLSGIEMDAENAEKLDLSLSTGTQEYIEFIRDGTEYGAFFSPIPGYNAWAVIVVNPKDLGASMQTAISNLFGIMIMFIILVIAVAACLTYFVLRSQKDRELLEKKEAANQYLEEASRAKSVFLFNMSHDVRTPMNAILGYTNIALKNLDDREKVRDALEKTQKSGTLLLSLINTILDVSRIESGKATLSKDKGDFLLSFVNIEDSLKTLAASKNVALSFEFGEYKDRYVICDFTRCSRIFINLISNAIKYTSHGGWVKVYAEQLDRYENGRGIYRYTVEDNGIGMSEEFMQHMFEQFSREQTASDKNIEGSGLGLSVCKAFTDLMGGTITCLSKLGMGTKFVVELPFEIQKGTESTSSEKEEAAAGKPDMSVLAGRRVLVVEDNEMNREIAVDILEEADMTVETAEDGSVAVNMVKEKGPAYYDFVLMDIQMPVMDGYEATRRIRKMDGFADLPVIAVSANAFEEDRKASLEAGMNDHVPKPINVNVLMQTMAKYFK